MSIIITEAIKTCLGLSKDLRFVMEETYFKSNFTNRFCCLKTTEDQVNSDITTEYSQTMPVVINFNPRLSQKVDYRLLATFVSAFL